MASLSRRRQRDTNIWPGFVDALATLLMVIIFLLMIFVLAQFYLGQALSGRDKALDKLNDQVSELADLLALERQASKDMRSNAAQLSQQLQLSVSMREDLKATISQLQARTVGLEKRLALATQELDQAKQDMTQAHQTLTLAEAKIKQDQAALDKQILQLSDLSQDIEALNALKQELEQKIADLATRSEVAEASLEQSQKDLLNEQEVSKDIQQALLDEQEASKEIQHALLKQQQANARSNKTLLEEKELSKSARAQIALLNQQMSVLRQQLASLSEALDVSETKAKEQKVQLASLGKRLNEALASKVQELSRYRSEFFGRLREILGRKQGIRIVGDRFVFQSEVLFAKGSADIAADGLNQLTTLAATLKDIAANIPKDLDWVMRIDGHTDNDPISTAQFPSNWELSSARAISVVKHLITQGISPDRLVAAGFGQYRPIDGKQDEIAKRRNRRIELKLTQR